jgi:hypothetical protein
MKSDKVVMSGSVALDATVPGLMAPNDVDFFVRSGGVEVIEVFLREHTDYVRVLTAQGLQDSEEDYVDEDTGEYDHMMIERTTCSAPNVNRHPASGLLRAQTD